LWKKSENFLILSLSMVPWVQGQFGIYPKIDFRSKMTIFEKLMKKNYKNRVETPGNHFGTPAGIAWNVLRTL